MFEIFAHLGCAVMDLIDRASDVFRSLPGIIVDALNHSLAHPIRPHDPGAKPLRMVDQEMKRCPLDGNTRSLEPNAEFSENVVKKALIAGAICQPVRNVAVRLRRDGIDGWRRVHLSC